MLKLVRGGIHLGDEADDILVRDRAEILVPISDRAKPLQDVRADNLVRFVHEERKARGRRDGDGDDDPNGASMARPANSGDHGRPGRQPVVDE